MKAKGSAGGRGRWQLRLPLPWTLALRYARSSRRDAYVSFLSVLATGGVALGVAALILVLAGLAGLQGFLRSDVLARTPHLELELPAGADWQAIAEVLRAESGVVQVRRLLRGRAWLLARGAAHDIELIGYEGGLPDFFESTGPAADGEGLFVGDLAAVRWGLGAGDLVELVSPRPTLTPLGPQPRVHRLRLAGTYRTGRTEEGAVRVAVPLAAARRLLGDRQVRFEIATDDLATALVVARRIAAELPEGAVLRTWQDLNRALFFTLRLEKMLMFVSVFLIVPVAAMALVTVLALLISSKRGEIGMLRAMGATAGGLRRAFLIFGSLLGGLGLALGAAAGIAGARLLDRFRLITPPGDVYFIDHVPFSVEAGDVVLVAAATLALTTASTLYAARRAAALRPVEALRR